MGVAMEDHETWNAKRIHKEINGNNPGKIHRRVSLSDVEKIVDAGFILYSWAGNPIRFRREDDGGLFLHVVNGGYALRIQYASEEPSDFYEYSLKACREFFRDRGVTISGLCEVATQDLELDKAIRLCLQFEKNRKALMWNQEQ